MLHHRLADEPIVKKRMDPRLLRCLGHAVEAWQPFSSIRAEKLVNFSLPKVGTPFLQPGFHQKYRSSITRIVYNYNLANQLQIDGAGKYHFLEEFPQARVFFEKAESLRIRIAELFVSMHESLGFRAYELREFSNLLTLRFVRYHDELAGVASRPHFDVGLFSVVISSRNLSTERWNGESWTKIRRSPNEVIVFPGFQISESSCGNINPLVHRQVLGTHEKGGMQITAIIPNPKCGYFFKRGSLTQEAWANKKGLDIFP